MPLNGPVVHSELSRLWTKCRRPAERTRHLGKEFKMWDHFGGKQPFYEGRNGQLLNSKV